MWKCPLFGEENLMDPILSFHNYCTELYNILATKVWLKCALRWCSEKNTDDVARVQKLCKNPHPPPTSHNHSIIRCAHNNQTPITMLTGARVTKTPRQNAQRQHTGAAAKAKAEAGRDRGPTHRQRRFFATTPEGHYCVKMCDAVWCYRGFDAGDADDDDKKAMRASA